MNRETTNKIIIVAESGADIPQEYIEKYGIYVVSMYVTMGDEIKKDGSFPVTDLYDYYEKMGSLPKTSAPNPEDYRIVFEQIHQEYPDAEIVHIGYSAATSCSFQNAMIASEDMPFVTHIDSKGVTAGQAALVIRTAKYLEKHPNTSKEKLVSLVHHWIRLSHMSFMPDNLEFLRAGGRVSNAACLGAAILSLKPLIEIQDGKLVSTKKYRGKKEKVVMKLIKDFFDQHNPERSEIYILWSEGFDHSLANMIEKKLMEYGVDKPQWLQTGTVITTHGGPGAFGLAGFSRA